MCQLTVMLLDRSRRSVLVKMALGDFRENNVECAHQPFEVIVDEISAEPQKVSTEENVSEKYLQHDIREV